MSKALLSLFLCLGCCKTMLAQTDSSTTPSIIKTLSLKQYTDYQRGPALTEMALVATLNRFPLPDDVLKFKKALKLLPVQVTRLTEISKYLQLKKTEIGQSVLRNEKKLDEMFSTKKLDEGSIAFYGNRYGLYEGEYRTSVLTACYNTYNSLTQPQLTKFWQLKNQK